MRLSCLKIALLLLISGTSAAWCAEYLYTPGPATSPSAEGILVREVTVKKGDTLSYLSKQYSGRGYYYPQILLFNQIKNPHRIRPGQVVRVPLARKSGQQLSDRHVTTEAQRSAPVQATAAESRYASAEKKKPAGHAAAHGEKIAYSRASAAFAKGDCESAVKLFDAFISRYPSSTFLAEATLNRAECYLNLSSK
jgi:TolA-binding protein